MGFDPQGFGERLSARLEEQGFSIKQFQERLRDEYGELRGTSYGAIWAAVDGQASSAGPRRETVEAMADLLDSSPEHLLYGTSPASPVHAAEEEAANPGAEFLEDVLDSIREGLGRDADAIIPRPSGPRHITPGAPPQEDPPPAGGSVRRALVMHTFRRLTFTRRGKAAYLDRTLGPYIGEALSGPLETMGVDPYDLPDDALTDYVHHMAAALRALYPEPPEPSKSTRDQEADDG